LALLRTAHAFGTDLDPEMPVLSVFNHVIVHVPGEQPLWIDPTDPDLALGMLRGDKPQDQTHATPRLRLPRLGTIQANSERFGVKLCDLRNLYARVTNRHSRRAPYPQRFPTKSPAAQRLT
jgi:hypothetical protein